MTRLNIKQAYIYGFGRWIDYSIDFSKDALVCVYGENESGKSTLQKFILFMLFGLPPKARQFYRPKTSGKMGGRLTVVDYEIGEFTIERIDEVKNGTAICYGSDGKIYDQTWLTEKLNGITDRIYRSIFSFSALDLIDFKKVRDEDLGEILLSIGLTGSNRVYETEKKLDDQIGELFKPFGKVPTINKQLDLLDALKKEMDEQLDKERFYQHRKEQLEEVMNEVHSLTKDLKQKKETLILIEKKKHALPLIKDYHYHQAQLGHFPTHMSFPQDGLERLSTLKNKIIPLKTEYSVIKSNEEQSLAKLKDIESTLLDGDVLIEAKELLKLKELYMIRDQKLWSINEDQRKLSTKISTKLNELNLEISEEELLNVSFPFQIEKQWGELRTSHEKLDIEKGQVKQEKASLQKQRHYLYHQIDELESQLLKEQHRVELEQRVQKYKSDEHLEAIMSEASERRKDWNKTRIEKEKQSHTLLLGSLLFTVIAAITAFLFDVLLLYYVGALILIFGLGQWVWKKQSFKQMERLFTFDVSHLDINDSITEQERLEAEYLLEQHEESKQTMTSIQSQLKSVERQLISWEEKETHLIQWEYELKEEIEDEQRKYPFLRQVHVKYWVDIYHSMNQLLGLIREHKVLDKEYENLETEQKHEHERLNQFVKRMMAIQKEDNDLILNSGKHNADLCFDYIEQVLNRQNDLKRLYVQIENDLKENDKREVELQEALNVYELEIESLYKAAQVETEEAFYTKSKDVVKKLNYEHKLQELSVQLSTMFSQEELDVLLHERLDEKTLTLEYESTNAKVEELTDLIDQKRQDIADLNAMITSMETSETYSNLMHQFNVETEQLQKLARKWAVLKTAKEVLTETKRKYRDKYLTKVIEETTGYFGQITNGKYKEVLPPMDDNGFQVVTDDGMRYKVDELSQGTVDQLYISLRLAISHTMSQNLQLPFIIDDAFVHFDDIRSDRMIDILKNTAKSQQVILFTCKPSIRQQVADAHVIHLGESSLIS